MRINQYDEDPWADVEALETQRRDVGLEMAEMTAAGDALHAARAAGRCVHASAVGYVSPPVYPEQHGLRPGQVACTDGPVKADGLRGCGEVFASDEAWGVAMDDAIARRRDEAIEGQGAQ
jgi:hypothetical protein